MRPTTTPFSEAVTIRLCRVHPNITESSSSILSLFVCPRMHDKPVYCHCLSVRACTTRQYIVTVCLSAHATRQVCTQVSPRGRQQPNHASMYVSVRCPHSDPGQSGVSPGPCSHSREPPGFSRAACEIFSTSPSLPSSPPPIFFLSECVSI